MGTIYTDNGHVLVIDEDRVNSIALGNGDPGGDGYPASLDGVELRIGVVESLSLDDTSEGETLVGLGSGGDDTAVQAALIDSMFVDDGASWTDDAWYDPNGDGGDGGGGDGGGPGMTRPNRGGGGS